MAAADPRPFEPKVMWPDPALMAEYYSRRARAGLIHQEADRPRARQGGSALGLYCAGALWTEDRRRGGGKADSLGCRSGTKEAPFPFGPLLFLLFFAPASGIMGLIVHSGFPRRAQWAWVGHRATSTAARGEGSATAKNERARKPHAEARGVARWALRGKIPGLPGGLYRRAARTSMAGGPFFFSTACEPSTPAKRLPPTLIDQFPARKNGKPTKAPPTGMAGSIENRISPALKEVIAGFPWSDPPPPPRRADLATAVRPLEQEKEGPMTTPKVAGDSNSEACSGRVASVNRAPNAFIFLSSRCVPFAAPGQSVVFSFSSLPAPRRKSTPTF